MSKERSRPGDSALSEEQVMINYAHRGASSYYPENTMSSFRAALDMGANGIETDVHETSDGVLVLFHDDTLDRVTDANGDITKYTFQQLTAIRVFSKDQRCTDRIASLSEFLNEFSSKSIRFAIELKQAGTEKKVIDVLEKYDMRNKATLTSFSFDTLKAARAYNPCYRIGYLYGEKEKDVIAKMHSIGGEELCPCASLIKSSADTMKLRREGFGVRVWGVKDEDTMKRMCLANVDGMTVNFPDRLAAYLREVNDEIHGS